MKQLRWIRLASCFDIEPFLSDLLRYGMMAGSSLLVIGVLWQHAGGTLAACGEPARATNITAFLLAELGQGAQMNMPCLLQRAGIALVLVLPCLRVLATAWYFGVVERNVRFTILTAAMGTILAYMLLWG